jgi:hypothetical protein
MEPILGVAKIRLSPVHEAVKIAALGGVYSLRDVVRLFQMIVPKKQNRPHQIPLLRRVLAALKERNQRALQFRDGFPAKPGFGTERSRFRRPKKFVKFLWLRLTHPDTRFVMAKPSRMSLPAAAPDLASA